MFFKRNSNRIFVIGNGPSLKETPLTWLDGDTFAMNRIHLLYPETNFRPSLYFMVDMNMQNTIGYWKDCIEAHRETPKFLWDRFREVTGELPNTVWLPRCERHHYYMYNNHEKRVQSWHLPEICTGIGGMSAMLQIAVLMGYEEIVVVGCDLGYKPDGGANHFHPNYTQDKRDRADFDNEAMTYLHEMAKRCSPVPIYNGTVGGELEVYDRVDINEYTQKDV